MGGGMHPILCPDLGEIEAPGLNASDYGTNGLHRTPNPYHYGTIPSPCVL